MWIALVNLFRQIAQIFAMDTGFQRRILGKVRFQNYLVGAAIAMIQQDDLLDVMQIAGDLEVFPEGLIPVLEITGQRTQRSASQNHVIVLVGHAPAIHVANNVVHQPIIHATEQQGFSGMRRGSAHVLGTMFGGRLGELPRRYQSQQRDATAQGGESNETAAARIRGQKIMRVVAKTGFIMCCNHKIPLWFVEAADGTEQG
ncbi:hypothetical protein BN874_90005 [Candidatus Contendobacter odensis Run_B_J11]|uniref:Uncharacterized protein n=1 Tax=Candidatus Contendobacter odensis Run_B_J11 TaxID=1400861 RepID=A0A7U7GFY9_9GAMM|nr:hypothetical protein BN874_90005 [Candidatus Contendobacter odensis Run_B_J11]